MAFWDLAIIYHIFLRENLLQFPNKQLTNEFWEPSRSQVSHESIMLDEV